MSQTTQTAACDKSGTSLTVYYDGQCPICAWEIGRYQNCGGAGAITWIDAAKSGAAPVAPDLSTPDALAQMHVRLPDGRLVAGAPAFVHIWAQLQGWRWLARVASRPLAIRALGWLYGVFLVIRPAMQWAIRPKLRHGRD